MNRPFSPMIRLPAAAVGQPVSRLFDTAEIDVPNPLVYANYARQSGPALRRSLLARNAPRRIRLPPVDIHRYPPGTLVNGDRSYLAVAGNTVIDEQVAPWCADWADEALRMRAAPPNDIAPACILLARYGENTWGHWAIDMLAKAAIAERLAPGRFLYAVPWWTTEPGNEHGYADRVLESLAAFGIAPARLVRLAGFQVYRFAALHDITCLSEQGLHPGALDILRTLSLPRRGSHRKIATIRHPPLARPLANAKQVEATLLGEGFHMVDLKSLPFLEQLRLFAGADMIAAGLGSDFWAVPFAEPGTAVISFAPAAWDDGYFIRLFQRTGMRHADLRGPSTLFDGADPVRSPHLIDPAEIPPALEAASGPETPDMVVDGETMPRRLGPLLADLRFGTEGNAAPFLTGDWSPPEPSHTWSLGPSSEIVLPASCLPPGTPSWVELAGQGHVYPPHLPTRPLTVLANGTEAGRFEMIGRTRLFCPLPPLNGPLTLTFQHPICPSPRQMGAASDDRPLGFGFERLCIMRRG